MVFKDLSNFSRVVNKVLKSVTSMEKKGLNIRYIYEKNKTYYKNDEIFRNKWIDQILPKTFYLFIFSLNLIGFKCVGGV